MIIHQKENSVGTKFERIFYSGNKHAPHFHRFLEVTCLLGGRLSVTISGETCPMEPGEAVFVFPNDIHSIDADPDSRYVIFIVSSDYIPAILNAVEGMQADRYVFRPADMTRQFFDALVMSGDPSVMAVKAAFYGLMCDFMKGNRLQPRRSVDDDLVRKALAFISENFRDNLTLTSVAQAVDYERHYVSRCFNRKLHMSFRGYLNLYRVDHARTLLLQTDRSIGDVALECGFQSLRSFDRAFASVTGTQPSHYREYLRNKYQGRTP